MNEPTQALKDYYEHVCRTHSDIVDHLPKLRELASECNHVTEFGMRTGNSTTALLAGLPQELHVYDLVRLPQVVMLAILAAENNVAFWFYEENVLAATIAETDFLFIDTYHSERQVTQELALHAAKVRRFIAFHDTTVPYTGPDNDALGLRQGINAFLKAHPEWGIISHNETCNGLAVIERQPPGNSSRIAGEL